MNRLRNIKVKHVAFALLLVASVFGLAATRDVISEISSNFESVKNYFCNNEVCSFSKEKLNASEDDTPPPPHIKAIAELNKRFSSLPIGWATGSLFPAPTTIVLAAQQRTELKWKITDNDRVLVNNLSVKVSSKLLSLRVIQSVKDSSVTQISELNCSDGQWNRLAVLPSLDTTITLVCSVPDSQGPKLEGSKVEGTCEATFEPASPDLASNRQCNSKQ